jgi:hypothetical protein
MQCEPCASLVKWIRKVVDQVSEPTSSLTSRALSFVATRVERVLPIALDPGAYTLAILKRTGGITAIARTNSLRGRL